MDLRYTGDNVLRMSSHPTSKFYYKSTFGLIFDGKKKKKKKKLKKIKEAI